MGEPPPANYLNVCINFCSASLPGRPTRRTHPRSASTASAVTTAVFGDEWGDVPQMMRTAKFLVMLAGTIGAK